MEKKYAVITRELTKRYDSEAVVNKLNIRVASGEIFGLLGPDKAGKTTTLLMLMGLVEPSSGEAEICGFNPVQEPVQLRKKVGFLAADAGFYENLTAKQNLSLVAEINQLPHGEIIKNVEDALDFTGLKDATNKKVRLFTPGMKQRLGLADAIINKPELVLLDEPLAELEDEEADHINGLIAQLPGKGISVMIASKKLFKMQTICDRIGILFAGKLVGEGETADLGERAKEGYFRIEIETRNIKPEMPGLIGGVNGVMDVEERDNYLLITAKTDVRSGISRVMSLNNLPVLQMKIMRFNLNEIYTRYFRQKE